MNEKETKIDKKEKNLKKKINLRFNGVRHFE